VIDRDDICPELAGPAASKGCPDTDGDGVTDNDDRCVTLAGPASNRGCPELKREDREVIDEAVRMVQFETGKAVLLPSAHRVLNDLAGVLQRNPQYNVAIKGHTDSQGGAQMNHDLSHRRAQATMDYLIGRGIAKDRMSSAGFGETMPIADNNTAAGRAKNRRVEFELYIK
jgi:outer membrane protein OmpA-like peptidoglycan-associated protein